MFSGLVVTRFSVCFPHIRSRQFDAAQEITSAMNDPTTLQEFINLTKGIEYIIAILFLLLFPIFWKFLNKEKDP